MVTYFSKGKVFHKAKMVTFKKVMFFFRQKSRAGEPGIFGSLEPVEKKTGAGARSAWKKKSSARARAEEPANFLSAPAPDFFSSGSGYGS